MTVSSTSSPDIGGSSLPDDVHTGITAFELRTPDDASQGTYAELRAFLGERGGSEGYRSVVCQEVGHSVGLAHPTNPPDPTCMIGSSQHLSMHDTNLARADARTPSKRHIKLAPLALAGLVLFAAGAAARITIGSGGGVPSEAARSPGGNGQPPAYAGFTQYQTLPEIVLNSDLVIVGTVQEVAPGYVEPSEDGFPTRYLNSVLKVDEAWKGSPGETVTVATNELAYGSPGGGSEWREPGVRVVAFLASGDGGPPGVFYPADEPAIYVLSGEQVIPTVGSTLSGQIAAMPVEELRQAVQAAAGGQ
jgi:hypothetical protein